MKASHALALLLALGAGQAPAQDHQEAMELRRSGEILPLEEVLRRNPRHGGNRVLEVELERRSGRYVYDVETLDRGGQVHRHRFDARTGETLRSRPRD